MWQRTSAILLAALVAAVGCSKGPSIKTYPVKGTVTYNGKPVGGATVSYVSKRPDARPSTGVTEADGSFSVSTYVGPSEVLRGAEPGDYRVTIVKQSKEAQQAAADTADYASLSEKERADRLTKMWEKQGPSKPGTQSKPTSEIPVKYATPETSDLSATVVVGENEPREFKLTDD
ncbi:MAG TPA: carboxypeptidase-like regulatory domain-containing protein [Pirellulales bacterium]|nr:carboxypeptidase-like regulatory domain-containing protein [Pirellulales bacterium]